jgi:hypothetical protein
VRAVSGAGLTEAGVPPLTLVSPGTPTEPSASPAAETLGGRDGIGRTIRAASGDHSGSLPISADAGSGRQTSDRAVISNETRITPHEAGQSLPTVPSLAPDAEPLPARPHGGPEDQAGAAAPACSCGHDAWEHTWRCNAQLAPDEWCDCIEWREA